MKIFKTISFLFIFFLLFWQNSFAAMNGPTWETGIRPGADTSRTSSLDGSAVDNDALEDPTGIAFSNDGLKVFVVNKQVKTINSKNQECLRTFNLTSPYDLRTAGLVLDEIDPLITLNGETRNTAGARCEDINFNNDGTKLFLVNQEAEIFQYNLKAPFELSGITYEADSKTSYGTGYSRFAFNNDGTKIFSLLATNNNNSLKEYSLSSPFDITSPTLLNNYDLDSINNAGGTKDQNRGIEFSNDGTAMFILSADRDQTYLGNDKIYQFQLTVPFDTTSASLMGYIDLKYGAGNTEVLGHVMGFAFDKHGTRLFSVSLHTNGITVGSSSNDIMHQYSLECSYGLVGCVDDSISNIGSQVQLAKQNVNLNTSIIFKRFEWIKRNRESENLNSFNFDINYNNQLLETLANNLKNSKKFQKISINKNKKKDQNNSQWSYWTHGDISLGSFQMTSVEEAKDIETLGVTFGADKKYKGDKFFGFAIRYGDNKAEIRNSFQDVYMNSLTLNIYGVNSLSDTDYMNTVFGLSALKFKHSLTGHTSGERYGKQAFVATNFRTNKKFGKYNFTPSSRFTYAVTHLSNFTDFISDVKAGTNTTYDNEIFESGEITTGFLFNTDKQKSSNGTIVYNGGLEFVYDFTPDVKFHYYDVGSSNTNLVAIENYSKVNVRGNFGFEKIYLNGITFSINYEIFQHLDTDRFSHTDSLLFKLGRINEDDINFALNYNPLKNNQTEISYLKNINGFDVKLSSNYSLMSKIPDYGANLEVSGTF